MMTSDDLPRESDAYPGGTVAASEDPTDPADREDEDEGESQCGVTGYEEEGKP